MDKETIESAEAQKDIEVLDERIASVTGARMRFVESTFSAAC